MSDIENAIKDILSGTMGGISQVVSGHPLDTIKVRLATQNPANPVYGGMIDCMQKTFRSEGLRGLYKGAASPLAGAMFHNAALFFSYGQSRRAVAGWQSPSLSSSFSGKGSEVQLTLLGEFYAGAIAGGLVSIVETPIDLLKIKVQSQIGKTDALGNKQQYSGVFDAGKKIYSSYGFRGLYQGLTPTVMRNVPAFGGYFLAFEAVKRMLTPTGQVPTLTTCFFAGAAAGFGFWGLVYPLELVKTRLQNDSPVESQRKYRGVIDCFQKTIRSEGVRGFFRGYIPANVRAVPVNACVFLAVTATKRQLANNQATSSSAS